MSHDAALAADGTRASDCPRCKPGPCVIGPAATMANLSDGVRVRERYGPWPLTGTIRVDDGELLVRWDDRQGDGRHMAASVVVAEGPATLSGVLLDELELIDPQVAAVPLTADAQALRAAQANPGLIAPPG